MELKNDPELIFLDECIKVISGINARTDLLLHEWDTLKKLISPRSIQTDEEKK